MNRPACLAAVLATVAAAAFAPDSAAAPPADPDHARLAAMCGEWNVEMTLWPRPGTAGTAVRGTATIRPLFDGLFIEEKIDAALNGSPITTLAWTGFNPATRQYEATRIASTSPVRIAETGAYEETARQLELTGDYRLAGETWHQRTVVKMMAADAMIATSYLAFGNVPEWKAVEIRYARR